MQKKEVSINFDEKKYSLETGRLAKQAGGSVMVRCGDTMVLVTVVATPEERDVDYLPLQVEYREKTASAGKFPGGFLKREGRPSDHEVLAGRLIDRPIRPMIPKSWRYDTQIIATVYSAEPAVEPDTLAMVGASAALMISDVPYDGPVSEVRVGRVDGEFVINPSFETLKNSDIDLTIAGTDDSIMMVEGESDEISEEDFLKAILFGHEKIKELNGLQRSLVETIDVVKRDFEEKTIPEKLVDFVTELVEAEIDKLVHTVTKKTERSDRIAEMKEYAVERAGEEFAEDPDFDDEFDYAEAVSGIVKDVQKKKMRKMILEEKRRIDGRELDEIRQITCEVDLLPRSHGSALFTRGETQSLATATLGTKSDVQLIDGLLPMYSQPFYLHYNFPPFCTGETGRMFVGRREIGHGNLAERALRKLFPEAENFPYTVRVVSDILESNGSSSMATVCAGSLALFSAGVPMGKPVAGIAMGLVKEGDDVAVLSDILGDEDFLGDMDFKVAGSEDGITACQMDIKIDGMPIAIMETALEQARQGRLHILSVMNQTISEPKSDLSEYAPRFTTLQIPPETIGAVIGSGGETIREICAVTNTDINIDDDGTVLIAATSGEESAEAVRMIQELIRQPEEGEVYEGTVKEVREGLGAIIEFLPKKTGLLHISQIAHERTENVSDVLSAGDTVEIKLLEIQRDGKYRLSRKALLPRPEGMPEDSGDDRRRGGGRDRRGGGVRDDRRRDDRRRDDRRRSGGGDRRGGGR